MSEPRKLTVMHSGRPVTVCENLIRAQANKGFPDFFRADRTRRAYLHRGMGILLHATGWTVAILDLITRQVVGLTSRNDMAPGRLIRAKAAVACWYADTGTKRDWEVVVEKRLVTVPLEFTGLFLTARRRGRTVYAELLAAHEIDRDSVPTSLFLTSPRMSGTFHTELRRKVVEYLQKLDKPDRAAARRKKKRLAK